MHRFQEICRYKRGIRYWTPVFAGMFFLLLFTSSNSVLALGDLEALKLSKAYLQSENPLEKEALAKKLITFTGDIDRCLFLIRPRPSKEFKRGFSGRERFTVPELKEKYAADQLYFFVPESYDHSKPAGLFIFMHGGGTGTPSEAARKVLSLYISSSSYMDSVSFVGVAPSAPPDAKNSRRWSVAGADEYISAVITEAANRFNIDPDRVVLAGHSMGGMGAYCLGLRMSDRFSTVLAHSGSWLNACWPVTIGTPFFIIHGSHDAVPPGNEWAEHRPHFTDIAYARIADSLLTTEGIDHIYAEHPWGHSLTFGMKDINRFLDFMQKRTRDPYQKHVVAATPADGEYPSPNNRWINILETGGGTITLDGTQGIGKMSWEETLEDWKNSRVVYRAKTVKGGTVDAENKGNNRFIVNTVNVKKFELWLHPSMIDFSKPVIVTVNGKEISRNVKASLVDALRSYERRHDWGLIYHACLTIEVEEK
jgi:predicted esterase